MADGEGADPSGGVCLVWRAQTEWGADEEVAALLGDFAHQVRTEESDCISCVVTRELGARERFAVHARFSTWKAFKRHGETPHMARLLARLSAQLAGPIGMEIFFEV